MLCIYVKKKFLMINRLKVNGLQSKYQRLYGVLFVEVFPPIFI